MEEHAMRQPTHDDAIGDFLALLELGKCVAILHDLHSSQETEAADFGNVWMLPEMFLQTTIQPYAQDVCTLDQLFPLENGEHSVGRCASRGQAGEGMKHDV